MMEAITLATTERQTTRLGFGCSGISGGLDRRHSVHLLETAFDAGIRHFDVAPMYGYGTAEAVLGAFLKRHAGQVTVTTKFGLLPEQRGAMQRLVRAAGKRLLRHLPRSRRAVPQANTATAAAPLNKAAFTAEHAEASLHHSLRLLGTDSVDLFLLHEAVASDLSDAGLLTFLQRAMTEGKIRAFGVGSTTASLPELLQQQPQYCPVVQSEWNAFDAPLQQRDTFHITHRALHAPWQAAQQALLQSPERMEAWCREIDADLRDAATWTRLLLRAALVVNPATLVLFSTQRPERILQNVAAAEEPRVEASARRLHELLREEKLFISLQTGVGFSTRVSPQDGEAA